MGRLELGVAPLLDTFAYLEGREAVDLQAIDVVLLLEPGLLEGQHCAQTAIEGTPVTGRVAVLVRLQGRLGGLEEDGTVGSGLLQGGIGCGGDLGHEGVCGVVVHVAGHDDDDVGVLGVDDAAIVPNVVDGARFVPKGDTGG